MAKWVSLCLAIFIVFVGLLFGGKLQSIINSEPYFEDMIVEEEVVFGEIDTITQSSLNEISISTEIKEGVNLKLYFYYSDMNNYELTITNLENADFGWTLEYSQTDKNEFSLENKEVSTFYSPDNGGTVSVKGSVDVIKQLPWIGSTGGIKTIPISFEMEKSTTYYGNFKYSKNNGFESSSIVKKEFD